MKWQEKFNQFDDYFSESAWLRIASILEVFGVSGILAIFSQVLNLSDHQMAPIAGIVVLFSSIFSLIGAIFASFMSDNSKRKNKGVG